MPFVWKLHNKPSIVSLTGEGNYGYIEVYNGKDTTKALKAFISKHSKNGFAKIFRLFGYDLEGYGLYIQEFGDDLRALAPKDLK